MKLKEEYEQAILVARSYGWTLGEEPQTLPAKIAADRVARLAQERGQAIKAPSYGSGEYELLVARGSRLTLKSDPHRRADRFWKLLPAYVRAVESCENLHGKRVS